MLWSISSFLHGKQFRMFDVGPSKVRTLALGVSGKMYWPSLLAFFLSPHLGGQNF
jgi:hypothetical protein